VTRVRTRLAGQGPASRAFYQLGRFVVVGFARVWNRLGVEGREHVPAQGAFILAPVHRSNMDTPYAAVATLRRLRYMGKDSLWRNAISAWLLSALGGFPVSRDTADREALHRCLEVLEAGEPLVLFPEGERKSGPVVLPLKDGAAYLAARAGVPIVPVGIGGSERAMGKGARMIRPSKVYVVIGAPLRADVAAGAQATSRRAVKELSDRLHERLQELFDEAQIKAGA
jgi:1-acyl-sn-glycerol-3-phosphate acyltransferase